jgi:hypothetical protein
MGAVLIAGATTGAGLALRLPLSRAKAGDNARASARVAAVAEAARVVLKVVRI